MDMERISFSCFKQVLHVPYGSLLEQHNSTEIQLLSFDITTHKFSSALTIHSNLPHLKPMSSPSLEAPNSDLFFVMVPAYQVLLLSKYSARFHL
jgi:hypothetical protein